MTPIFIKHRVNSMAGLSDVHPEWGIEIDLRSEMGETESIHLAHDPWTRGERLDTWLKQYCALRIQGPLILNTKEDGLETRAQQLMAEHCIENYFFLDTTIPTLRKQVFEKSFGKFAIRVSSLEEPAFAERFRGKVDWIWVDCFGGQPLSVDEIVRLRKNFKICLVSPELHTGAFDSIQQFGELYKLAHAVCTKKPELWLKTFIPLVV